LPPPNDKVLQYYANCLGLKKDSSEWYELFELAAAGRIKLPKHLSESELIERMPALFRASRSKKSAKQIISKLKKILKETWEA